MKSFLGNGKRQMQQVLKNGSRSVCNYHLVSLTLHVCKVLESIFRDRIINHLSIN